MKSVIYILSLSYSGSTAFSYLLSTHPKAVALGEINAVIRNKKQLLKAQKPTIRVASRLESAMFGLRTLR